MSCGGQTRRMTRRTPVSEHCDSQSGMRATQRMQVKSKSQSHSPKFSAPSNVNLTVILMVTRTRRIECRGWDYACGLLQAKRDLTLVSSSTVAPLGRAKAKIHSQNRRMLARETHIRRLYGVFTVTLALACTSGAALIDSNMHIASDSQRLLAECSQLVPVSVNAKRPRIARAAPQHMRNFTRNFSIH